jgi:5-(carboxyamino)imidazole ribonucleotide mutase
MRVASAHKTPAYLLKALADYEANPRPKVYVTIVGRSNALSGMADTQVSAPANASDGGGQAITGADIFSSLRMPSGVAPAVILDPEDAALFAVKVFASSDAAIRERVAQFQQQLAERLMADDADFRQTAAQG